MAERVGIRHKALEMVVLFLTMLLFWVLLNGTLAIHTMIVGVVAALVITFVLRDSLAIFSEFKVTPASFKASFLFAFYFIKELIKSNLILSGIILTPSLPINPGIVKARIGLKSRMGRLFLANAITLTPGTLTVDLRGEWIYIHWVTVKSTDIDEVTEMIVTRFESYLKVMYG